MPKKPTTIFPKKTLIVPPAHMVMAGGVAHGVAGLYAEMPWPLKDHAIIVVTNKMPKQAPTVFMGYIDEKADWRASLEQVASFLKNIEGQKQIYLSYPYAFCPEQKSSTAAFCQQLGSKYAQTQDRRIYVDLRQGEAFVIDPRRRDVHHIMDHFEVSPYERLCQKKHIADHQRMEPIYAEGALAGLAAAMMAKPIGEVYQPLRSLGDLRDVGFKRFLQFGMSKKSVG